MNENKFMYERVMRFNSIFLVIRIDSKKIYWWVIVDLFVIVKFSGIYRIWYWRLIEDLFFFYK